MYGVKLGVKVHSLLCMNVQLTQEKQVSTVVLEGYLYAGVSKHSFCGFDVFLM